MSNIFLVMTGGAIGAALRYLLGVASLRALGPGYPWGTLGANVLGGFAMGLVAGWLATRAAGGEPLRLFVAVGILGGFTTFSAFSLDVFTMVERGQPAVALGYVLASVIGSILLLLLGYSLARAVA